jgi:hypothetical protein
MEEQLSLQSSARPVKHKVWLAPLVALLAVALICSAFTATSTPVAHASGINQCIPSLSCVHVWATNVNVHDSTQGTSCFTYPQKSCTVRDRIASSQNVAAYCQHQGESVTYNSWSSSWWMLVVGDAGYDGWISNVFITGNAYIKGVPTCNW